MDIEDNFPQFQSVNENSNLTGISQDMTQLIEKQNDLMRQHLMVPSIQALNTDEVNHGLDLLPTPSIQRVDSVIRALPPKQVEDDRQDSRLQEIPNCQDREDLIAEKLKLKLNLLAPRSNTQTFTKMEQDLFSLIKQDEVLLSMEEAENSIDSLIRDIHTDTASTPTS